VRPLIAVTQRVDTRSEHGERRDCLDQRWTAFLACCGLAPLLMPNCPETALTLVEQTEPAGVLLTGGGDLAAYGGDAGERDETEYRLLAWARRAHKPVLGVCRGLELLLQSAGARLEPVTGHVATRHTVRFTAGSAREVNSYHGWAASALPVDWRAEGIAPDGAVEAASHRHEKLRGIMWHPERESPFAESDIAYFRDFFAVAA
jgi:gamma-glutamyl-gamma-aminobutyrate hydrolase PuuD